LIGKQQYFNMDLFGNSKTVGELKELLNNISDSVPLFTEGNKLEKASLDKSSLSLHSEGYSALFTARGEMHKASSRAFIKGEIDYTHVVCWKTPYDEPFVGINAANLKSEITKKIMGGFLEKDDRGMPLENPSLLNIIMSDVSQWARDVIKYKDVNYYVKHFKEVYDYRYSVSAKLANTAVYLEITYID
jgi:hypothetical protein